jgi:formyltetrahydrofolate synthetase
MFSTPAYPAELNACIHVFRFLYDLDLPLEDKIRKIAQEMYGAGDINLSTDVQKLLENYNKKVRDLTVLVY